jgi:thiamine kinase-like enzyme
MLNRQQHRKEIQNYLEGNIAFCEWSFTLPKGKGHETYFAHGKGVTYFVKVNAEVARYEILASEGLTPEVVSVGHLEDGATILVQSYIPGESPTRKDFQFHLDKVARIVRDVHQNSRLQRILSPAGFNNCRDAAFSALNSLRNQWELYKFEVGNEATCVEDSLDGIAEIIVQIHGDGLVASHNDICNANWILTANGQLFLVDLEAMSLGDPAADVGALLWWYYPPIMRERFLEISGYPIDRWFRLRMQVNLAMHSLRISLPRVNSFDAFVPSSLATSLVNLTAC